MDIASYEVLRKAPRASDEYWGLSQYITGIGEGYGWANAQLQQEKQPLLFCAPKSFAMNSENYLQILDEAIAKHRESWQQIKVPIGGILLFALRLKLPCESK